MFDYLILTEKPSAARNFASALGGKEGSFNGNSYKIVNARGHLFKLAEPQDQVYDNLQDKYTSWETSSMPWNLKDLSWKKVIINQSVSSLVNEIRRASKSAKAIVIATDNDPSGEGELLAWEVINGINWKGKVYREYHDDETSKSIQKAMNNLVDISDQTRDGDYQKAFVRNRWDFASMQETRLATKYAREAGYYFDGSIRQGRLKSVIASLVYQREIEIKNYVKKPFFEVKFKDENGNLFARKISKDDDDKVKQIRHESLEEAKKELVNYNSSSIVEISRKDIYKAPRKPFDLSDLDATISSKGFSSQLIQSVYQKLYEAKYVSYPRTEDKFITTEQFDELVLNSDKIAALIGVDPSLLSHKTPRSTHVKDSATHGANRPGEKIPNTLDELKSVVKDSEYECAKTIYNVVARGALAMLAEDAIYESISGKVENYPTFTTKIEVVKKLNWKLLFGGKKSEVKVLGKVANPVITEGANPKPKQPTKSWVYKKLSNYGKYGIGTGATQQSTMAELTNKKSLAYMLNDSKGKLNTTEKGIMTAVMGEGTMIASPEATVKLFEDMDAVGKFQKNPDEVLNTITDVVIHDKNIFANNVSKLKVVLGEPKSPYYSTEIDGNTIHFKKTWSSHKFSDSELERLAKGETITFKYKTKSGKTVDMSGQLEQQEYNGKKFWGFKPNFK